MAKILIFTYHVQAIYNRKASILHACHARDKQLNKSSAEKHLVTEKLMLVVCAQSVKTVIALNKSFKGQKINTNIH